MKVSKALEDVWKWKEEVYQEIRDMTSAERVAFFKGSRRRLEEKTALKLDLPRAERWQRRSPDSSGTIL